jgi:hypothetical protein
VPTIGPNLRAGSYGSTVIFDRILALFSPRFEDILGKSWVHNPAAVASTGQLVRTRAAADWATDKDNPRVVATGVRARADVPDLGKRGRSGSCRSNSDFTARP